MISRLFLGIAWGAFALQMGSFKAEASPCPGQACFELVADASTTTAGYFDETGARQKLNARDPNQYLTINSRQHQLEGYSFNQPMLTFKAIIDRNTLNEGSNHINVRFTGTYLIGVTAYLKYWSPNAASSRLVCSNRFTNATVNNVSCSINLSLNELDPVAAAEIEGLKRETAAHRARANTPNQAELNANALERQYENERAAIDAKIARLNHELQNLNFADFDTLSAEAMAQLISEDPTIRALYRELKGAVDQVKTNIQTEVQSNQQKVTQLTDTLRASFGDIEVPAYEFNFEPHGARAEGGVPAFDANLPQATGPHEARNHASLDQLEAATQQTLERLDSALRDGNRGLYFAIVKAWQTLQEQTLHALTQNGVTGASLHRVRQAQGRVLDHVRNRIDLYGFFREVRIPETAKQIAGEKLKQWDEGLSRDLLEELNGWQEELNPAQQKVIEAIDLLGRTLDRLSDPRMNEPTGDPLREEAKEIAKTAVKTAIESVIRSAQVASGTTAEDQAEAIEIASEASAGLQIALQFADFAIGMIPFVGGVKDLFEAITGTNCITGEPLSFNERVLSTASGLLSLGTFGSSNLLKGPLKAFAKTAKKALPAQRAAQRVHRIEEVTHEVGKIVDSAASLAHTNPNLRRKLDYVLGKATGSTHNVERSQDMLRQMERIGFPESQGTRTYLADHLKKALNDPASVLRTQENGRVVRESLLNGPRGTVKVESVWEDAKLITVGVFGKGTGFTHGP